MIKGNNYLYGADVDVPVIPADVIMRRIELLNDNLQELMSVSYVIRDTHRCNAIIKAISFWRSIQDEEI